MITIKKLLVCSLDDALTAWNMGFEDYFVDVSLTMDRFVGRMAMEELSPNMSIVAFDDAKPIGIIKSGIRDIKGKKVAWNGGTAVLREYRKRGIAKRMMYHLLDIYNEESANLATLEAIKENRMAISLYKSFGYVEKDELANFSLNGSQEVKDGHLMLSGINFIKSVPQKTGTISFYKAYNLWQTHWKSVQNGEAIIALDARGKGIGYAYYKKVYDETFQHKATVLYQCEADPTNSDAIGITRELLTNVPVIGPMPDAIQKVWERIFAEWFPATGYEHAGGPELEVYPIDGEVTAEDHHCEVWIPIVKK